MLAYAYVIDIVTEKGPITLSTVSVPSKLFHKNSTKFYFN